MSAEDWISVSDDEQEMVEQMAFKAACEQFYCINDKSTIEDIQKSILRAFMAIREVANKYDADLKERHVEGSQHKYLSIWSEDEIVSSAYYLVVIQGLEYEPDKFSAKSVPGFQITLLAHTFVALENIWQAEHFMSGEAGIYGSNAKELLEKLKPDSPKTDGGENVQ